MIKKHRPQRVLLAIHWLFYYCRDSITIPFCMFNKFDTDLLYFVEKIKEIQAMGIQVSTINIDFHHKNFDPTFMLEFDKIIEENILPVKRS